MRNPFLRIPRVGYYRVDMSLSELYRRLAGFIDELEAEGITVRAAELDDQTSDETAVVELRVELPLDHELSEGDAESSTDESANGDGTPASDDQEVESDAVALAGPAHLENRTPSVTAPIRLRGLDTSMDLSDLDGLTRFSSDEYVDLGIGPAVESHGDDDSDPESGVGAEARTGADESSGVGSSTDAPSEVDSPASAESGDSLDAGQSVDTDTDVDTDADDVLDVDDGATVADDTTDSESRVACLDEDCSATFESEHGMKIHYAKVHRGSTPPYRDPERLREVYATGGTFEEMADRLDSDVSAQTVRRYMIEHDIHDPDVRPNARRLGIIPGAEPDAGDEDESDAGDESSADGDTERNSTDFDADRPEDAAAAVESDDVDADDASDADGVDADDAGDDDTDPAPTEDEASDADTPSDESESDQVPLESLPLEYEIRSGVTVDEVRSAVAEANTLFDVQQRLGIERDECVGVLSECNLLDLVQGRLATRQPRDARQDVLEDRLRRYLLTDCDDVPLDAADV